ncbi:Transcriptional regulator, AraC family [Acinetobacter sp. neg1]|uniref:AraC family transcriptional regulator n=1 Tax=Acinetobacter sp. neg1 TaxID=1561068 RepID=UPI000542A7C7|nr:AraC family transcriptional regulator [Acinetobacter sp. neg1]KHF78803.1 Transcriptional regulator, AraC family [Acinetobacter sp. neg1]
MKNKQTKIRFQLFKHFLDNCEEINLDRRDLLEIGNIDESFFVSNSYYASLDSFKEIIKYSSQKVENPFIILKHLLRENISTLSPLGLLMTFSENLREALLSYYTYRDICGDLDDNFSLCFNDDYIVLKWSSHNNDIFNRLSTEYQCAWWLDFIHNIASEIDEYEVKLSFEHSIPDINLQKQYQEFYRCNVSFNAETTMLSISNNLLNVPLKTTSRELYLSIENHILDILLQYKKTRKTVDTVRSIIHSQLKEGGVTRELVAEKMGISARTLTRRLNADGSNYSSILDDVRLDVAKNYLLTTQYKIVYISKNLGFFTCNAFITWFKEAVGVSPGVYRDKAKNKILSKEYKVTLSSAFI